ncbi:MAG: hypothetical protein AB7U43_09730 [Desulfobacter sp.]
MMERLLKLGNGSFEELDRLSDLEVEDLSAKPAAPGSGNVSIYARSGVVYRQRADGAERALEGPEYRKDVAGVARLCPAYWNNAGVALNNENRIWSCVWPTPGYLYVIGGCTDNWDMTDTVLRASWDDLASWEQVGALPAARAAAAILQDGAGDLYLFGGYDSAWGMTQTIMRTVQRDFGRWEMVSGASAPVVITEAIAIGDKRYMVSGYDSGLMRSEVWEADENDLTSWQVVSYLPEAVTGHSLLVVDDTLYVIGGTSGAATLKSIYTAQLDNLASWTTHSDCLFKAIYNSNVLVLGEKVILMGGLDSNGNPCDTIQLVGLSDITGSWQAESDITEYAYGRVHFAIDRAARRLWRIGGEIYSSAVNMLYTDIGIDTVTVAEAPNIPVVRQVPRLTVYQAEEVILTGILYVKGLFFEGVSGRKGIEQRAEDGAIVLLDDDNRIESRIITEDDLEAAAFYRWGALK